MYFPEPYYGYAPQGHFYHSNMIAQQGHAFLAERPFNSPPPCFYSSHKEHPFPERTVASQAVSTQNSYQPYNLPQSHVQRRQVVREEPAITTQGRCRNLYNLHQANINILKLKDLVLKKCEDYSLKVPFNGLGGR